MAANKESKATELAESRGQDRFQERMANSVPALPADIRDSLDRRVVKEATRIKQVLETLDQHARPGETLRDLLDAVIVDIQNVNTHSDNTAKYLAQYYSELQDDLHLALATGPERGS